MEYTSIFLCYRGEWIEDNKYTGSNMMGILVPQNCTYKQLIDMLFLELQLDPEVVAVTIHYKVGEYLSPVRISSNNNLQCYLNLKMIENDPSRFPLCIDVTMVKHGHSRENVRDIQFTSTDVILVTPLKLPSLHHISSDICTSVEEVEEFIDEQQEAIISTLDANAILIGKLFRNKEVVKINIQLYAIHNQFEFNVCR
ncbi:uncharacterized protein Fot_04046 [Forsythia ovata]|uniref:Uncharacterized protein n=1 Tax=Forsythia ovata TaxID=205694 RepID=A0ABD1XBZ1_9LAMI